MAGFPSINALVELFSVSIIFFIMTGVFLIFYNINVINGIWPELTSLLHTCWYLFVVVIIIGIAVAYILAVQRGDTISGLR
ncbi:hypothetical protein [Methanococcus maripaludis]|uniref:Mg2+ and Co2+ transporter CorA n=1 Tax=Methanococcus maripaludis TaxID=39152 RepID=A0A7J9PLA4_METMI|nr:hypothetical protein [Methanococcus maripaludis]MBA2863995.1 Mg2+ and Co2+ transporter CorA [Methanococcus maripaludis]